MKCTDVLCVWCKCEQIYGVCMCIKVLRVSCWWYEVCGCVLYMCVVQTWVRFVLCVMCMYVCVHVCVRTILEVASSSQVTSSFQFAWDFTDFSTESPYRSQANPDSWSHHPQLSRVLAGPPPPPTSSVWRCEAPSAGCSWSV